MNVLNQQYPKGWSPDILIEAAQTGNRIGLHPQNALQELEKLERDFPAVIDQITKLGVDAAVITRALAHLGNSEKR